MQRFLTKTFGTQARDMLGQLNQGSRSNAVDPEYAALCADTARTLEHAKQHFEARNKEIIAKSKKRAATTTTTDTSSASQPATKRARQNNAASSPVNSDALTNALEELDHSYSPTSPVPYYSDTPSFSPVVAGNQDDTSIFYYAGEWCRASSCGGSPVAVPQWRPREVNNHATSPSYSPADETPGISFNRSFQGATPKEYSLQDADPVDDSDIPLEFATIIPVVDLSQE